MRSNIAIDNKYLGEDESLKKVIPYIPCDSTRNSFHRYMDSNSTSVTADITTITFDVPKGFKARIILEKNEAQPTSAYNTDDEYKITKEIWDSLHGTIENGTAYDIINNRENKIVEVMNMTKNQYHELIQKQLYFLLYSFMFIIVSLVGFIIFYRTGLYIVHPAIYLVTLLMGTGWSATALASIKNNKVDIYGKK